MEGNQEIPANGCIPCDVAQVPDSFDSECGVVALGKNHYICDIGFAKYASIRKVFREELVLQIEGWSIHLSNTKLQRLHDLLEMAMAQNILDDPPEAPCN